MVGMHEEAIRRLCFVCTKIIKAKERKYSVEENIDMLSRGLSCNAGIVTMDGVTPENVCKNCFLNLLKVTKGENVTTNRGLVNWEECKDECRACNLLSTKKAIRGGGHNKKVCFLIL